MSVTEIKNETFRTAVIDMDNKRFFGCKFSNCTLRYTGAQCEWDANTVFDSCTWQLLDAAERTVSALIRTGRIQFPQGKFSVKG
jgi:hypothetical protein